MLFKTLFDNLRDLRTTDPHLAQGDEIARAASYPPPYPEGWYKLADSADVARGDVRYLQCLGERLVLFRSDVSDELGVLDANCPHQGANLAGGTVKNVCLECPFHRWTFRADGVVADVPYCSTRTAALRTPNWPVREYHGLILMYYSPRRTRGAIHPVYELEPYESLLDGSLVFRGAFDHPRPVRMHLVEFAENSIERQTSSFPRTRESIVSQRLRGQERRR